VHQDDVGVQLPHQPDSVRAVGRLADHLDAVLGVEQRREPDADEPLVVSQQYPDHRAASGSRARPPNPRPSLRPPASFPPSAPPRSVMPRIPLPPPPETSGRPAPSSSTSITRSPSSLPIRTLAPVASACRTSLVSASCTIRSPAASTPRGRA